MPEGCDVYLGAVSDAEDELAVWASETAAAMRADPMNRLLAGAALALGALAVAEMIGIVVVGMAVKVQKLNAVSRQGYAFLTQLEKSPVGLMLVVAAILAAVALIRTGDGEDEPFARWASRLVLVAAVVLGVGTVLGVLARFRVAEIAGSQPVDAITRRQLVVFVIRNFGTAVVALLIAVSAAFQRARVRA